MPRQMSAEERETLLKIRYAAVSRDEVAAMGGLTDDEWLAGFDDPQRKRDFEFACIAMSSIGALASRYVAKVLREGSCKGMPQ